MPTPEQILEQLGEIARDWRVLAVFWHAYFGVLVLALLLGKRLSRRTTGMLLGLPLLSVSALAWATGNPFNGLFFALSGIASLVIAGKLPRDSVRTAPAWLAFPGVLLFAFGWVYPHFLDGESLLPYLYSAPTGLIPCPTLSIVIGLTLVLGGLDSRAWSLVLSLTGIFYGVFGAVRLGVVMDGVLVLGAAMLGLTAFFSVPA